MQGGCKGDAGGKQGACELLASCFGGACEPPGGQTAVNRATRIPGGAKDRDGSREASVEPTSIADQQERFGGGPV
jgi:hypothetical protein